MSEAPDTVAIVTRTKDRPLLLARAAQSVAGQTFRDFLWIVVNDGGDEAAARDGAASAGLPAHRLVFINQPESRGMEAASNAGISAAASQFVAIHDDDDAWHPDFLKKAVAFLTGPGARYGGVVTGTTYVSEDIVEGRIVERGRAGYNPWLDQIELGEILVQNLFPPIAFLYRRRIWEDVGGYDASLPVLGDWDFNIRFLTTADIGLIREPLAYYHNRSPEAPAGYANTVVGQLARHTEMSTVVRNKLARSLGTAGAPSVLPALGYLVRDLRRELTMLRSALSAKGVAIPSTNRRVLDGSVPLTEAQVDDLDRISEAADRRFVLGRLGPLARSWLALRRLGSKTEPSWPELLPWVRRARLQPPEEFDEDVYLLENTDVPAKVRAGRYASGYDHYIQAGRHEGRRRPLRRISGP